MTRMYKKTVCWSLFFFLATCGSLHAQDASPKKIQSCRTFVQGFYNWYLRGHFIEDVIKYRSNALNAELLRLLKDSMPKGDDEGFVWDWDPFLAGNDPGTRYSVGRITRKGDTLWVGVHHVLPPPRPAKPDVTAEVMFKDGRWFFVNFHYAKDPKLPMNDNLLSILKWYKSHRTPTKREGRL